jgi:polysaccharide biosynthesis transport protein
MRDFRKLSIEDVLRILWRRRWYVVLSTILGGALGAGYAWSLPPIYSAATTILVESQFVPEDYVRSTVRETMEERINSIKQQLHSRAFLGRIIEDFGLYGSGGKEFVMETAIEQMRNQIEIIWSRNTFVVAYRSTQPHQACDVTKRLAKDLIEMNNRSRKNQAIETDEFIDVELRRRTGELTAHEEKLRSFKTAHLGELPDQVTMNLEALNRLQAELSANESALQKAQSQRMSLERSLDAQTRRRAVDPPAADRTPPANEARKESKEEVGLRTKLNTKIEQRDEVRSRYTSKHPEVVKLSREVEQLEGQLREATAARIRDVSTPTPESSTDSGEGRNSAGIRADSSSDVEEATKLGVELEGIKAEISTRQKQHEYLVTQIRIHENRRAGAPRVEQELFALTREHEALKQQHKELQQKKFNAQVAANLETSAKNETLKVIDEAYLPEKPVGPPRQRIALMGIAAGVLLGFGLVVGGECVNSTIADENQAAQELGMPILISIPKISAKEIGLQRRLRKVASGGRVLPL